MKILVFLQYLQIYPSKASWQYASVDIFDKIVTKMALGIFLSMSMRLILLLN